MNGTGIVILAAGNSSRLGRPKQLLAWQDNLLVQRITAESFKAALQPVVVVTGANAAAVSEALTAYDVISTFNQNWRQGMGSSIAIGIAHLLLLDAELENVIIAVCDQPFVTADLFSELYRRKAETGRNIVACSYEDTVGTPVLFGKKYFEKLRNFSGEEGAKKLLKLFASDVAEVSFPEGAIDIDTDQDYLDFLNMQQ